jgi:hypothetical protein
LYLRKWLKRKAREMIKSKKEDKYTKVKADLVLLYLLVGANIIILNMKILPSSNMYELPNRPGPAHNELEKDKASYIMLYL